MKVLNLKFLVILAITFVATSQIFAQDKTTKVEVKAEKVEDGVKITTTQDGKTSSIVVDSDQVEKYMEKYGENLNVNIEEGEGHKYKIVYNKEGENTNTIEVDVDEIIENLEISLDDFGTDITKMVEKLTSQIEYEETVDKDGNKSIKIKTVKVEDNK